MIISSLKCKTDLKDDVNGTIKDINVILEELNTMVSRDTKEESKKTVINNHIISK